MTTTVNKPIPIRRPTTQETALQPCLRPHCRQHALPCPRHLTLRLRAQQHHEGFVHRAPELDRTTRLRQPHRDTQRIQL